MKELKFTPDNFRRHFVIAPRVIWTTRDKQLNLNDSVIIISPPPQKRESVFKVHSIATYFDIRCLARDYWELEGFESESKFLTELEYLYPNAEVFYVHELIEIIPKIGNRCFDCKYFSESVLHTTITDNDFWNYCTLHETKTKRHYTCTSLIKAGE